MTVVIKGARLVDGTGRDPIDRAVVVIEGRRITAVGQEGTVTAPASAATVIDAEGRTVLPGLMDLHAALAPVAIADHPYGMTQRVIASTIVSGVVNARRYLDVGVTTCRVDMTGHHGIFALKEAFAAGVLPGPRLFVPGRPIATTGGHAWPDGSYEVDGVDAVRRAVREQVKAGADWIKFMVTGGAGTATERAEDIQMTPEELKAGVVEARNKGKLAFAHVCNADGARMCVEVGINSIEHGIGLDEEAVHGMRERGVFLVPTLGTYRRLVELGEQGKVPEHMYRKSRMAVERHARGFRLAIEAGVKIAAGTDSGYEWYPAGESLLGELEMMNGEGLSPMRTLMAATSKAAECLRQEADLGTLESGKLADVLIVDGDPLADLRALRNTWLVLKEGREVFHA